MKKQQGQRYTGRRIKKKWRDVLFKLVVFMMIVFFAMTAMDGFDIYHRYVPKVTEGRLVRQISEVVKYLPEAPENFEEHTFEPQIPKIIKEDIQSMKRLEEVEKIVYENKNGTVNLTLEMIDDELVITCKNHDKWFAYVEKIFGDIAIYRVGDKILVYGQYMHNERTLAYFEVTEDYAFDAIWHKSIDLLGIDKDGYDYFECGNSVTMIREGKKFSFYRFGEQIGESTIFPGAEIKEIRDGYILDDDDTLYYAYYCASSDNPWVRFVKVAENIDGISNYFGVLVSSYFDDYPTWFAPYEKEGKQYLAVPDLETFETYGISKSGSHEGIAYNPKFWYSTVEISDENVYMIHIYKAEYRNEWKAQKLYYEPTAEYLVYTEERISGIDTYVTGEIPKDMLKKFDNLYVSPADYPQVVEELKALYEQYY